jgi:predicted Zn-dependent peptidase
VVDDFIRVGATTRELDESKSYYVGSYPFRFETSRMIAREILEAELYGLGFRSLAEYPQKISKIIEADVLASARRYLSPEAFSIVIMGNADSFKDQMGKVGIVETLDFQTMVPKHRAS